MEGLRARGAFSNVTRNDRLPHPFEDGGGNDEGTQLAREAVCQLFFASVRLWALPAVSSAMVVHVASFLDLTDQRTSTVAAFKEAREGEIVFDLSVLSLVATVQDFLAPFPRLPTHQRLMNTLVDCAGVLELARVDA